MIAVNGLTEQSDGRIAGWYGLPIGLVEHLRRSDYGSQCVYGRLLVGWAEDHTHAEREARVARIFECGRRKASRLDRDRVRRRELPLLILRNVGGALLLALAGLVVLVGTILALGGGVQ